MFDKRARNATAFNGGEISTVYKTASMGNKLFSREAVDRNLLDLTDKRLEGIKLVGIRYDKRSQTWLAAAASLVTDYFRSEPGAKKLKSDRVRTGSARLHKKK